MKALILAALPVAALLVSAPAAAQFAEVNDPAPGASSLLSADYANAERTFEQAIEGLKQANALTQLSDAYAIYSEFLERRGQSRKALEVLKQAWKLRDQAANAH